MGATSSLGSYWRESILTDPLMTTAVVAALVAMATTPVAFIVLARYDYLRTRRGRSFLRPSFASVVCGMMLVMGIPAIFLGLSIKSRSYEKGRYEFDPNEKLPVLKQGRDHKTLESAIKDAEEERDRLKLEQKKLVESVKKLDTAMLSLRNSVRTVPAFSNDLLIVLDRLAAIRRSVGLDAPQQLIDDTAPPAALPNMPNQLALVPGAGAVLPMPIAPQPGAASPAAAAKPANGLAPAELNAELADVPDPQKPIAAMLPLADIPAGWTLGKPGAKHLETFNAENLFEKIDGRAESFIQYQVQGMAYAFYTPVGDDENEVQVYIFDMSNPLQALGKYGSEKPADGVKILPLGTEGYASAGSTLFYADRYYTQIVSTKDDPKFADFALTLAKRIAAMQIPKTAPGSGPESKKTTPQEVFALLPKEPAQSSPKFAAQDVFGYGFLTDVFMADFGQAKGKFQGFIRPYASGAEAKEKFELYLKEAKRFGAEIKDVPAEGADRMFVASIDGLVDAIFLKGNVIGGANGAAQAEPAEAFAKAFVKSLPPQSPFFEAPPPAEKPAEAGPE